MDMAIIGDELIRLLTHDQPYQDHILIISNLAHTELMLKLRMLNQYHLSVLQHGHNRTNLIYIGIIVTTTDMERIL